MEQLGGIKMKREPNNNGIPIDHPKMVQYRLELLKRLFDYMESDDYKPCAPTYAYINGQTTINNIHSTSKFKTTM